MNDGKYNNAPLSDAERLRLMREKAFGAPRARGTDAERSGGARSDGNVRRSAPVDMNGARSSVRNANGMTERRSTDGAADRRPISGRTDTDRMSDGRQLPIDFSNDGSGSRRPPRAGADNTRYAAAHGETGDGRRRAGAQGEYDGSRAQGAAGEDRRRVGTHTQTDIPRAQNGFSHTSTGIPRTRAVSDSRAVGKDGRGASSGAGTSGAVGKDSRRGAARGASGRGAHRNGAKNGVKGGANQNGAGSAAAKNPNAARNLLLFALLLCAVIACIVTVGAQSCSRRGTQSPAASPAKDDVRLNTPTADTSDSGSAPTLFAEFTDGTKELDITSGYGILIDLDTNKVLAAKSAQEKIYPASMTKIMTLIVAYENVSDTDATYTFKAEMLDELFRQNASVAGFSAGESVPVKDLFYGCILPSGADATGALAEYVAGSEEAFAVLMNKKAAAMGLKNTHFVTASGLHDDNHYSTCEDMAAILRYAVNNTGMREILSTYQYTTTKTAEHPDGITLTSTLKSRMSGNEAAGVFVQGGKTGYTIEGRNCLATFAANCTEEQAALTSPRYILVTAFASGEYTPVFDAINVYSEFCS